MKADLGRYTGLQRPADGESLLWKSMLISPRFVPRHVI